MIRRPPRSTRVRSSAASDVYKRQGVTAGPGLEVVEEVEHDLGEWHSIVQLCPLGRQVGHLPHLSAPLLLSLIHRPDEFGRGDDHHLDVWFFDGSEGCGV